MTAARPIIRPVDRSQPRTMRTMPAPSAMMIRVEDWARMLLKLMMDRNRGSMQMTTMISASRTT